MKTKKLKSKILAIGLTVALALQGGVQTTFADITQSIIASQLESDETQDLEKVKNRINTSLARLFCSIETLKFCIEDFLEKHSLIREDEFFLEFMVTVIKLDMDDINRAIYSHDDLSFKIRFFDEIFEKIGKYFDFLRKRFPEMAESD